jgi:antitoxin MazE
MVSSLVRIGNSRGIRLPKAVIEQCGFGEKVELSVSGRSITISRMKKPREGWAEAAVEMHAKGMDAPLIPDDLDAQAHEDWVW